MSTYYKTVFSIEKKKKFILYNQPLAHVLDFCDENISIVLLILLTSNDKTLAMTGCKVFCVNYIFT